MPRLASISRVTCRLTRVFARQSAHALTLSRFVTCKEDVQVLYHPRVTLQSCYSLQIMTLVCMQVDTSIVARCKVAELDLASHPHATGRAH